MTKIFLFIVPIMLTAGIAIAETDFKCMQKCQSRGYVDNFCLDKCSWNQHPPLKTAAWDREGLKTFANQPNERLELEEMKLKNEILRSQLEERRRKQGDTCGTPPIPPMGCQGSACICDQNGQNCQWTFICR